MSNFISNIKPSYFYQVIFFLCVCIYLALGIRTELDLIAVKPIPNNLLEDFGYYEQALNNVLGGKNPYSVQSIGPGYLYPPPALFIVEAFHYIKPFYFKFLIYSVVNIALMLLIISGTAKFYGYSTKKVWYWYAFCLGFAPFLELLTIGQINTFTLFGIFLLFFWLDSSIILSGFGLSLAILTKVSPIIFLGYLAITKKFGSIISTMVWGAIITILCILRYGSLPVLVYPETLQWLSHQYPIDSNSQSLVSKFILVLGFAFHNSEIQIIQSVLMLYILLIIVVSSLFTIKGNQPKEASFILTSFGMTILPNVIWYHHYVFILFPILIWMGWKHLDTRIVIWCLLGLTITQIDRFYLTDGLLIHIFIHISILSILLWQTQQFYFPEKIRNTIPV